MLTFALVVGDAVNQELLGYRQQHAGVQLPPAGAPWTEHAFQSRSGYYSTVKGQQMAALFRERRQRSSTPTGPAQAGGTSLALRDVFVSHATEDKDAIARPLAEELRRRGPSVWFDEYELVLGDWLRERIDDGLAHSRIGVVILSRAVFAKRWTAWELNGLVARLTAGERNVIVPVWHEVGVEEVRMYSPPLADLVAARSADGVAAIADAVERVLAVVGVAGRGPRDMT